MNTALWPIGNGQSLQFEVFKIGSVTWNKVAGLYIFTYSDGKYWQPLYIGQTNDFSTRLPSHERLEEAARKGATHIHAAVVQQQANRDAWEKSMIAAHQPPLNEQHRDVGIGLRRSILG
jgi:hypothetical protein